MSGPAILCLPAAGHCTPVPPAQSTCSGSGYNGFPVCWGCYLVSVLFIVWSNHHSSSVQYFHAQPDLTPRQFCWIGLFKGYNFLQICSCPWQKWLFHKMTAQILTISPEDPIQIPGSAVVLLLGHVIPDILEQSCSVLRSENLLGCGNNVFSDHHLKNRSFTQILERYLSDILLSTFRIPETLLGNYRSKSTNLNMPN